MKRIYRAINEGISLSLINFGNGQDGLEKTPEISKKNIMKFQFGDYVFYDSVFGYNNKIGEKAGICIDDTPGQELYIAYNHPLQFHKFKWANEGTSLYNEEINNYSDGWENTCNVLNNYKDELYGTIWGLLKDGEYIPSSDEMTRIFTILKTSHIRDIKIEGRYYWTSTLYNSPFSGKMANVFFSTSANKITGFNKNYIYRSIVLLHIN